MNKTVNINLGGMFFHIDEDAYQKLTRYFDAIKRSLSNSTGQDEIIKDIEMRIAEIITEKQTSDKQVINAKDVDEVIVIMGQPEDYRIEDDGAPAMDFSTTDSGKRIKKLYRDKDGAMIGGVLAGLGHYFGIDKVWLRIALLFLLFFYGAGLLAYIILWIVMPEAVTTADKLEMRGEPVTISNIEKKVREEFEAVSEKFKNTNFDKAGNQVKTNANRAASSFGDFLMTIFNIFAKMLGVMMILSGIATLVVLFIGMFTLGSAGVMNMPWQEFIESGNFSEYPVWVFGFLMFLAIGIPFFFLTLLGFKLLSPNMKSIGNIAKYTLLALWLISIAILISLGIKQATEFAIDGRVIERKEIPLAANDTLLIKFKSSEYFSDSNHNDRGFMISEDSTGTNVIYSTDVYINILESDSKVAYLQIEKKAKGRTLTHAKKSAQNINYGYTIVGNQLILDDFLLTEFKNKFRDQEVELNLYLPAGTYFKPDSNLQNHDRSDDDFFNLHDSGNYLYKVEPSQVKCMNCPADENDMDDLDSGIIQIQNDSLETTVKIDEKGIQIKENGKQVDKKVKSLQINDEGVIIKTE